MSGSDASLAHDNSTESLELFLLRLRYKDSRLIWAGSNKPILLDDSQSIWVVYTGQVDVFSIPVKDGQVAGSRHHLFRAQVGHAIFGMDAGAGSPIGLLAVGGPDTQLLQVRRSRFAELAQDHAEVASLMDAWVMGLSSGIAVQLPPKESKLLESAQEISLAEHQPVRARRGVFWISHRSGHSQFMGQPELPAIGEGFIPITHYTWLQPASASQLDAVDTQTFIRQDPTWSGLDRFHKLVLDCVIMNAARAEQAEQQRLRDKAEADRQVMKNALLRLTSVLRPESAVPFMPEAQADPLLAACQLVGQALGLELEAHPEALGRAKTRGQADLVRNIARANRVRYRQVALRGEWWRTDCGPLLAFKAPTPEGEGHPVALLPAFRRYDLLDPVAQTRTPVTPEIAASLAPFAYVFYRPLPGRALSALDLGRFSLRGSASDLLVVALIGLAVGLLGTVTPLATGVLFDSVIPSAERGQLAQLGLALFVGALAAVMFQVTQNMAVLRLESKLDTTTQAAVWDRLLRLPVPFFRNYSAGDLANRAMGISVIRQLVSGAAASAILSGVASIFSFALLFWYDARLAWAATGLFLVFALVTFVAGHLQVRHQRALTNLEGQIAGIIQQFVTGIAKFRVAGAEGRAFAMWSAKFSAQKEIAFKARTVSGGLAVFNSAYPVLASLVLFAMVTLAGEGQARLSTGAFLAFYAAFTQFLFASLAVSSAIISTLSVVAIYEKVRPILQTRPEVDAAKADPGELRGGIEVSHLAFRYREDEPLVLKDVSLHVKPGEFVALVGPSGSGKSTLIRLLLGFETALSGAVYYDGHDLAKLDMEAVRRQAGVVLQDGKLIAGDILTNIVGASALTADDAWEAARMVGLDRDIDQMPMELHTVISEGGRNLSGGQRQRLLIARAIVNRPRILFFDEATSSLDNRTQALVGESLKHLNATRVVIAHRLSTVLHADHIYVVDDGRIVQSGTYAELMRQPGLFAELARRQLA